MRSRLSLTPCLVVLLALPISGSAWAQGAPAAPAANPVLDAARGSFEALGEPDRKAIQDALIWTGDYSGMADGSFGRQTFEAINAFQARTRQTANGSLTSSSRTALFNAAQQAKNAVGFTVLDDPKSGVRIGIPSKVLPKQDANQSGGSRWQSADGKVTLDTRVAPPDSTLQAIYDRNLAIQAQGRVVTYKIMRPDFFVIAGETQTGKFYTRYASGPAGIRAFSIGYDKALAPTVDRLVVAIANSFVPFPSAAAPVAPRPVAAPVAPTVPASVQAPTGRRLIGTGVAVSPRQVVTTAPVGACANLLVAGLKPQKISGQEVALLDFSSDLKARPASLTRGSATDGAALLTVAFTDEAGTQRLTAIPSTGTGGNSFSAPLQPGASGAPVLDGSGALVGLVGPVGDERRKVAGIVPATSYRIVPASDAASLASGPVPAGLSPAGAKRTADLVALVQPALVPIVCGP